MKQMLVHTLIVVTLLTGCNTPRNAWQRAQKENTDSAYTAFIQSYPDSEYADLAKQEHAWLIARSRHTFGAYNAFRKSYPDDPRTGELDIQITWVTKIHDLNCLTGTFKYMYNNYFNWERENNAVTGSFFMNADTRTITDATEIQVDGKPGTCEDLRSARAIQVIIINDTLNTLNIKM